MQQTFKRRSLDIFSPLTFKKILFRDCDVFYLIFEMPENLLDRGCFLNQPAQFALLEADFSVPITNSQAQGQILTSVSNIIRTKEYPTCRFFIPIKPAVIKSPALTSGYFPPYIFTPPTIILDKDYDCSSLEASILLLSFTS